jgi:sialic acid synthase SpsE
MSRVFIIAGARSDWRMGTAQDQTLIIRGIRSCEEWLGPNSNVVLEDELELRRDAQSAIHPTKSIKKGYEIHDKVNLEYFDPSNKVAASHVYANLKEGLARYHGWGKV